jgi:hypothetical protein
MIGDEYGCWQVRDDWLGCVGELNLSAHLDRIPLDIREAVLRFRPNGPGMRNFKIYMMARWLKNTYPILSPESLEMVARLWWETALPYIRTKEWRDTLDDFGDMYRAMRCYRHEQRHHLEKYKDERYPKIARLRLYCEYLTRNPNCRAGVFYLSDRHAAEVLGCSHTQSRRIIHRAMEERWLVQVAKGVPHPTDRTGTTKYRLR